jgi:hypothetical protein
MIVKNDDVLTGRRSKVDGAILIVTTALTFLALTHHPQIVTHDADKVLAEIDAKASIDRLVHGTIVFLLGIQALAFWGVFTRLGTHRILAQAGAITYFVGFLLFVQAALIDGFLIASIGSAYAFDATNNQAETRQILSVCGMAIRLSTAAGMVASSLSYSFWSTELLRSRRDLIALSSLGLVLGVGVSLAILTGIVSLNLSGALLLVGAQSIWNIAVGVGCWRGRL